MQYHKSISILSGDSSLSLRYTTTKDPHTCPSPVHPSPSDPAFPGSLPETWAPVQSSYFSKQGQHGGVNSRFTQCLVNPSSPLITCMMLANLLNHL